MRGAGLSFRVAARAAGLGAPPAPPGALLERAVAAPAPPSLDRV